jgi:hypothetical protein
MENAENWVSLREFSRMRGVSLGAVQKAIESGRVTAVRRGVSGKLKGIEAKQAMHQWDGNTDADQAARSGAPIMVGAGLFEVPPTGADVQTPGDVPEGTGTNDQRYLAARARKQEFEAHEAELRYLQALGRLIATDDLANVTAKRYAAIRDKLLNIPDRLATILAAEKDAARVHAQLTGEIKRVLNELANDSTASAEAAERSAERVAA